MPLSPPIGTLIAGTRWLGGFVAKRLFLGTYIRSHRLWTKRHQLGVHWERCGEHFEYSLYLAHTTDPEPRTSKIAVRATGENIASVSMLFEAESDVARFQEQIAMININQKAIVWTLTNIPHQQFVELHDRAGIRFSWDAYKMCNIRIKLQSGRDTPLFDTPTSDLTHTWFLNSDWIFRWGQFWNLDTVKWAKNRLAQYWRFRFGMPGVRTYGPTTTSSQALKPWRVFAIATRPIAWLMAQDSAVTVQFWLAIWSRLFVLNEESQLQLRWHLHRETSESGSTS